MDEVQIINDAKTLSELPTLVNKRLKRNEAMRKYRKDNKMVNGYNSRCKECPSYKEKPSGRYNKKS